MTTMTIEARIVRKLFYSLRKDPDCVEVMSKVSRSSSEPDQIVCARVQLDVFARVGEFRFKLAPRFAREWWSDLLCALQTRLPEC